MVYYLQCKKSAFVQYLSNTLPTLYIWLIQALSSHSDLLLHAHRHLRQNQTEDQYPSAPDTDSRHTMDRKNKSWKMRSPKLLATHKFKVKITAVDRTKAITKVKASAKVNRQGHRKTSTVLIGLAHHPSGLEMMLMLYTSQLIMISLLPHLW